MARLIDADALRERISSGEFRNHSGMPYSQLDVMRILASAPAIDAAPVRRGEWVYGKRNGAYGIWCSRCGTGWGESPNYEVIAVCHNFCPNCGADMRGETE